MRNRLIRRVSIDSLKSEDQFKISGSSTLYTYNRKERGHHLFVKWLSRTEGVMMVVATKSMIVELVDGHGYPDKVSFGSSARKFLVQSA